MPARKKRRPAAKTVVDTPAGNIVEPVAPPAVVSVEEPAVQAQAALRPRPGLLDVVAFPFEVAVTICLLPFGRRSGAR